MGARNTLHWKLFLSGSIYLGRNLYKPFFFPTGVQQLLCSLHPPFFRQALLGRG